MNRAQFLKKWHSPPKSWVLDLNTELVPNYGLCSVTHPWEGFRLRINCRFRDDSYYPVIEEQCASARLGRRRIGDVEAELLTELDAALSRHTQHNRSVFDSVRQPSDKPVLAVLCGAGFSAAFGLPVTRGLKECVAERCSDPLLDHSHFDYGNMFAEAVAEFPLREFLAPDPTIRDFEYLLTLWPGYREQLNAMNPRNAIRHDQFYKATLVRVACHPFVRSWEASRSPAYAERRDLLSEWLRSATCSHDVRFITFNYDVVLEQLCLHSGFRFEYLERQSDADTCAPSIPLRKLHGSINWQEYDGECSSSNARMWHLYSRMGRSVYAFPEVERCRYGASGKIPVLIPPAADKKYDELFQILWTIASREIQTASRILIVGYSFPPIDAFATNTLAQILREKPDRCLYVCRNADVLNINRLTGIPCDQIINAPWEIEHFYRILQHPFPDG